MQQEVIIRCHLVKYVGQNGWSTDEAVGRTTTPQQIKQVEFELNTAENGLLPGRGIYAVAHRAVGEIPDSVKLSTVTGRSVSCCCELTVRVDSNNIKLNRFSTGSPTTCWLLE